MTPGPPCRLTCPHCGGHKHIKSINSGNTFGGTVWSDSKHDYPMLPQPSVVQYCPHCGHYFFYEDGKAKHVSSEQDRPTLFWRFNTKKSGHSHNGKEPSPELKSIREETYQNRFGELTFVQVDAAYDELSNGRLSEGRMNELLFLWLFKYNDEYGGRKSNDSAPTPSTDLTQKHAEVLKKLIAINGGNTLLIAELYRELGQYDKCIELAKAMIEANEDGAAVAKQFLHHAEMSDSKVFQLIFEGE